MIAFWNMLALMAVAHALCDYPLQGDFLSRAKNPSQPIEGVPWQWAMFAHSAIHAGAVGIITGIPLLAMLEFFAHWGVDCAKCNGAISFNQDQWLHIACKLVWSVLATVGALQ